MQTKKEPGRIVPAPAASNPSHQARRRVVSWVTAVAAVVVIALITTALLISHSGKPSNTGTRGQTATSTPASSQGWNTVPGLAHVSDRPFIAPSNPKIIYLLSPKSGAQPMTLKRSDDDGAHWTNLALPQASQAQSGDLIINPGDAQNVFLLLNFSSSSAICSGGQASAGQVNAYAGGGGCQLSYYSVDGGAQWGLMLCVTCAQSVGAGTPVAAGTIAAQGNHLYTSILDQNQVRRLITSTDGGATWRFADGTLVPQGLGICSFAAAPGGSSVYALVQSGYCSKPVGDLRSDGRQPQARSAVAVWRSDDGGAHWTKVSDFPYQQPDTGVFAAVGAGAQPTLYMGAGMGSTYQRLVSIDGGKTWQRLPTNGLPANAVILDLTQATLSDGSILATVQTALKGPTSVYALKPGSQTWRRVAPASSLDLFDIVVAPSASGHDTLWVVGATAKRNFSVLYYTI